MKELSEVEKSKLWVALDESRRYADSARIAWARREEDTEQGEWARKYFTAAEMHAADARELGAQVPELVAPWDEEARTMPNAAEPKKGARVCDAANRCRVRMMRRFYAACKGAGLDTKEVEGMKAALAKYLGRPVPSRRNLSAGEWAEATAGAEFGLLTW